MNNLLRILFATILSSAAIAQEIINTDKIVLEKTSEILKTPTSKLKIEESFYNQISPGEYVDIIEIAMGRVASIYCLGMRAQLKSKGFNY